MKFLSILEFFCILLVVSSLDTDPLFEEDLDENEIDDRSEALFKSLLGRRFSEKFAQNPVQSETKSLVANYLFASYLADRLKVFAEKQGLEGSSQISPEEISRLSTAEKLDLVKLISESQSNSSPVEVEQNHLEVVEHQSYYPNYPKASVLATTKTTLPTTSTTISYNQNQLNITDAQNQVFSGVDKILGQVASNNIPGIVQESINLGTSQSVSNLVNGIFSALGSSSTNSNCNALDRLFNRCA